MSTLPKNKIYKTLTEKLKIKIISNEDEFFDLKNNPPTDEDICYKIRIFFHCLPKKTYIYIH